MYKSLTMQAETPNPNPAPESTLAAVEAVRLETLLPREERGQQSKPRGPRGRQSGSRLIQRLRSDHGDYIPDDVETLMMTALDEADRWQAWVSREEYRGECSNKVPKSRKRNHSSGREVSERERLNFAPVLAHIDPPTMVEWMKHRTVGGMSVAECLSCGEAMRRLQDSDRACPKCHGRYFAWQTRQEGQTYLGEDYSLPSDWYGDLTGVGAHWSALEALVNTPRHPRMGEKHGKAGNPIRLVPIGPDGTMRYLVTKPVKIGEKRGPRFKVYFEPLEADMSALFADGSTGESSMQTIS